MEQPKTTAPDLNAIVKVLEETNEVLKMCHGYVRSVRMSVIEEMRTLGDKKRTSNVKMMGVDDQDDIMLSGMSCEQMIKSIKEHLGAKS